MGKQTGTYADILKKIHKSRIRHHPQITLITNVRRQPRPAASPPPKIPPQLTTQPQLEPHPHPVILAARRQLLPRHHNLQHQRHPTALPVRRDFEVCGVCEAGGRLGGGDFEDGEAVFGVEEGGEEGEKDEVGRDGVGDGRAGEELWVYDELVWV
jgi:hypothetical protein